MSGTGSLPDDPGERLEEILAEHRDEPPRTDDEGQDHDPLDPFAPSPAPDRDQDDQDDQDDDLPEAPLFALLRTIEHRIGVDRIDGLWIFPPRRLEAGETAVVVVAAFPAGIDEARRRVFAAHYTARDDAETPRLVLTEYGTAPMDRVGRLVEEVVERINEGPAGAPRSSRIEGRVDRWNALLHELALRYLEQSRSHPRLRP